MKLDAFTEGYYSFPSLDVASQLCINYYPDLLDGALPSATNRAGSEKAWKVLTPSPGLSLYCTLPTGPVRGLWAGERRLFAVGGAILYEVIGTTTPVTFVSHGNVGNDGNPVQFFPNGTQLFIVSAGYAYIDTGAGAVKCQQSSQLTDLIIDAATGGLTTVTGGEFDSTDIGCSVAVTSGAGFTVQTQPVTSVVNGMAFGAAAWGTPGSTDGNAIEWLGTTTGGVFTPNYIQASCGAFLDGTFFAAMPSNKIVNFSAVGDGTQWDPLSTFSKVSYPDNIAMMLCDHQEIYIFGDGESTEVWRDTGNADNPFQKDPGCFMHYGNCAPWSTSRLSTGVAWIGGDSRRGERVAFLASGYIPQRVSTAAIEKAWGAYVTVEDAVAYAIIQDGQEFWVINFPTANATWVYSVTLGEWHQRGWWNGTGWDRQRGAFHACVSLTSNTEELHYIGDWQNGNIYTTDPSYANDNGTAIHRRRRAPHMSNENKRRFYSRAELDCDVGSADIDEAPQRVAWRRFGESRDRVWQLDDDGAGNLTIGWSDDRCKTFATKPSINVADTSPSVVALYLRFVEEGS
jgi:hypothetical protein